MSQPSMKLEVYVSYPGHCAEAFRFYQQHLGGTIVMMMTHGQIPDNPNIPDNWKDAILHARLEIGGSALLGADVPNAVPMRSSYLTLQLSAAEEAERVYTLLSDGGEIYMKMEETFYASRFAMLRAR